MGVKRLPAEYKEVEWIEAINSAYIDTPITLGVSTFDVYFKYYKQTQADSEVAIIGCETKGNTNLEIGFTSATNRFFAYSNGSAPVTNSLVYDNPNDVHVAVNPNSPYLQIYVDTGNRVLTGSKTSANSSGMPQASIKLFCLHPGFERPYNVLARMYYAKFVRKDGTIIADFVPCYVKATGLTGMYETVSRTFYSSITSNNFVKGPDVR